MSYALFKNKIISTNILAATFFDKRRTIRKGNIISFYKSKKLNQEMLDECLDLYITLMVGGWEVKRTMVDNGSTIKMCSNNFLSQLQEKDIEVPPLEEATFKITTYDSSSKKPFGITIIMITIRVKTIAAKF